MDRFIYGPTYEEMLYPSNLGQELRNIAINALKNNDELNPINLYNITWKNEKGNTRFVVLPKELTKVKANIIVLIGKNFPSGSHKVGPAYSTLMEGEVLGEISPDRNTIIGPSTGNFGIGTAYISRLKGYKAIVVMPDNMSRERYEIITKYGGKLDLTAGTESDVILTLERVRDFYKNKPEYKVLAQFELLPNYRFHRYVTGNSILGAVKNVGNGKVAAFLSAPGSAGTIGAGDEIKKKYPECKIFALEPEECPTLYNNGCGQHKIEGIGDKMVTLIHNLLTTDYIMLIHDEDCIKALKLFEEGQEYLSKNFDIDINILKKLKGLFGISSFCNILGAIEAAKNMNLGEDDNIVTIATDSVDRYYSVLHKNSALNVDDFKNFADNVFINPKKKTIKDITLEKEKTVLYDMKQKMWNSFGYDEKYLDQMKDMSFWDKEYEKVFEIDEKLKILRNK